MDLIQILEAVLRLKSSQIQLGQQKVATSSILENLMERDGRTVGDLSARLFVPHVMMHGMFLDMFLTLL